MKKKNEYQPEGKMEMVKDYHYWKSGESTYYWRSKIIGEKRNVLCKRCMRVFRANIYVLIHDDETKAVEHFLCPTYGKPFLCDECKEKKKTNLKKRHQRFKKVLLGAEKQMIKKDYEGIVTSLKNALFD